MKRPTALGVIIPALAIGFLTVAASGVFAQDPPKGGGERPAGGGGQTGGGGVAPRNESGSVSRGGDGAPPSVSFGSSGGGSSSGGGGGSTGSSGGVATPRGSGWNGRNSANDGSSGAAREARPRDAGGFSRSLTDDQASGRVRSGGGGSSAETEVPWYSRSRSGNPSTGTVANRGDVPVISPPGGGGYYPYPGYGGEYYNGGYYSYNNCYYAGFNCYGSPWGYGGFGLGYFFYNPFGWNYGSYGYGGFGGYGDYGGGFGGGGYSQQPMGSLRLKVKPSTASVYVDGYYAGRVDDFDNPFQKLAIALGVHKIEISAPGYRPLIVEFNIRDWDTMRYEGRLEPIR